MNLHQNHWLTTARIGIGLLATTLTTLNFIAYIFFSTQFANMPPQIVWQPEFVRSFLATQGQDFNLYLGVLIGLDIFGTLCASSLIVLLLWRKADNWFGLYLSLMFALLIGFPAQFESSWSPAPFMSRAIEAAGIYMVFILLHLFPNGRFVPSWSRGLLIVYGVGYVNAIFFPNVSANPSLINQLLLLGLAVAILIGAGGQIYRYWRVSNSVERQQTKWSAFFFLLWILRTLLLVIPPPMQALMREPTAFGFALFLFTGASSSVLFSLFMISMVIAIFRYRLFDIDLIIRRTVQYTVISGLGFIAYLLAVGGTSLLFQARSDLAAGIITLVVLVSAFVWLRPRLETLMNKYMPLPQLPPEVLAEMEREKAEAERKRAEKEALKRKVTDDTRLQGRWLLFVRAAWYVCAALAAVVLLAAVPVYYSHLVQAIHTDPFDLGPFNLPFQLLADVGDLLGSFISVALAVFLFWRKPNDRMALFVSFFSLITGVTGIHVLDYVLTAYLGTPSTFELVSHLATPLIMLIYCIFPDGRFAPRWTRWLFLVSILTASSIFVSAEWVAISNTLVFPLFILATYAQVYRYRRVSNDAERKQTKWVLFGFGVSIVLALIASFVYKHLSPPFLNVLPLSLTIAILRARLWDIDIIIRRTVQYTVISGLGFIAYLLAVGGTSLLFQARSDLAAGIIALVVLVSAFVWLRPRLETLMNKYMPLPQLPPEVLAEMEHEKVEREEKKANKELSEKAVGGDTRLQSGWLTIVRVVWFVCALVVAIILLGALPGYYSHYAQAIGTDPYDLGQFNQSFQVLVGLSNFVSDFSSFALAILLFWRKPNDRMALFASFFLLITAVASTYSLDYFLTAYFGAPSTYELGSALQTPLWILIFCIFPDGRFVPRWTRWLFLASILISFLILAGGEWSVMSYPIIILGIYAQVYRHRRVSNDAERKQTQWVVFGLFVSLVLSLIASLIYKRPSPPLINIFPLSLTIAILHSRLWNIDLIIRRTVQYTVISGLGFVAYLLAVGGTSFLFQARSDLAAGIITIVVLVSAFVWLRPRLEAWMNKYLPLPQLPPEVLAEMEREKVEKEKKHAETATQKSNLNRILTIVFAILVAIEIGYLVVGLASIPTYYQRVTQQTIETTQLFGREFVSNAWIAQAAEQRNLSLTQYALYRIISSTLATLIPAVIALFMLWRARQQWFIWLTAFTIIFLGQSNLSELTIVARLIPVQVFGLNTIFWFILMLFFFLFPTGQRVPRKWGWLVIGLVIYHFFIQAGTVLHYAAPQMAASLNLPSWSNSLYILPVLLNFLVVFACQIYRYRYVSTPIERQQTKWFVLGFAFMLVIVLVGLLFQANILTVSQGSFLQDFLIASLWMPVYAGIAIAILRYRLFDIDLIIRRTVQYTVISSLGFIAYLLAVGGTSLLFQARSDLAAGIIASVVLVSAFVWLRPRLETLMNKYMPLPQLPPEVVMDIEHEKTKQDKKKVAPTMNTDSTRIQGNWLIFVRFVWISLALIALTMFFVGMPQRLDPQSALCAPPETPCQRHLLSAIEVALLPQIGLTLETYNLFVVVTQYALMPLLWLAMSALIFWRKSDDWLGVITAWFMIGFPFAIFTGGVVTSNPVLIIFGGILRWFNGILPTLFFFFPNGRFVPRWTRWVVVGFAISHTLNFIWQLQILLTNSPIPTGPNIFSMIYFGVFLFSVGCQIYRYWRVSTTDERRQTKWIFVSILTLPGLDLLLRVIMEAVFPQWHQPGLAHIIYNLIADPLLAAGFWIVPIAFAIAVLRYRLYAIDLVIRRTVIYGGIVGGLALIYFGGIALLQFLSQVITGPQSDLVIILITLLIVVLFNPVRRRLQTWLDRAFYREKVDFREALTAFTREVRTIIDLQELLRTLVNRTTDLLHITHGAVFLWTDQATPQLAEGRNFNGDAATLTLNDELLNSLESGHAVSRPDHSTFPLLIPLIAPTNPQPLIGVLALGKRLSDQQYSREDQTLLRSLADQAGTALYVAQLIQERQSETQRRQESERQLIAYRHSPAGRAEALAQSLISNPQLSLIELHTLVQNAEHDVETAQLLDPLPHAFENLNAPMLTGFAEGYRFIFTSQFNPELLAVGLRQLIQQLESPTVQDVNGATEALLLYRFSQQALDVNSIPQISDCSSALAELPTTLTDFKPFAQALGELRSVCDALRAYERVDAVQDKLAYLASAIERLSHAERYARAELSLPDKIILIRLVANWLRVVTGAMSEVQTRARLVVQLLTRHTWTGEIVTVALNLRNEGRGIALNLKVSLAASTDYTLLDETAIVEHLSAGEETQVELRVRPRLTQGLSQFRARFIIIYDDSRGRDQVENFADVVYLLAEEGEFKFVPNPYVVGTPLQTGSSLFFGRADVFNFIQENLAAAHQNNLVLIGQRRTGKTSLLKQLPAQLGDSYMPIYLDGQSLALDPGLPNFFYSLATEIAFALEDRGLPVPAPELASFADSPTHTFERKFLAQVYEVLNGKHLLLLLDEFEELENAVRRGNIDTSVFSFLRHLMQHATQLSVIFCGTHRMEELAADYWSVLFNISLYKHIAFLGQAETLRLIQEPVASYGMKYDDLALDKMWRVTAGHPYFLQLLCHSLVNRHNKSQRNYLTIADVNDALEEILATGEAHFVYLWTESTHIERLVLTALSRLMPLTGHTTVVQVTDYLSERGINLERRLVADALHHLALRDILRTQGNEPARELLATEGYAWQLGLLGLWVEKYKSLSRVVDESRE